MRFLSRSRWQFLLGALVACSVINPSVQAPTAAASPGLTTAPATSPSWVWQNPLPQGNPLSSVSCPSASTCIAVGSIGTILASSDGGASWQSQISGTASDLSGVSCASSSMCVAVGKASTILVTTNGGATWQHPVSGTPGRPRGCQLPKHQPLCRCWLRNQPDQ